ncbi:MAG TPA: hypothetical protein DD811_02945 [Syntrophomonas sp.]|jgi:hypothetical protein|nr:hypothetical protein [Syntrophomonas sp.]
MCWSCNPYCGGCKPPKPKPRKCTNCGKFNFNEQATKCEKCGADLPELVPPPTVMCLYVGQLCANPCRRHLTPSDDGELKTCKYRTVPKR